MSVDYDEFLYDNYPFAGTHPDVLSLIGRLFGMEAAHPARCRVLEIGCGLGGNLLAMAVALPESDFVGIDLSVRQIDRARADAAAIRQGNVDYFVGDVRSLSPSLGQFDYVICHGVYSWVDEETQAAILGAFREHLAPHGVAYLSYNTFPGWHLRGAIRAMLQREVGFEGTPRERVKRARDFLAFLSHGAGERNRAVRWLSGELEMLADLSDAYLFYEYLVERNAPVWFEDLVRAAQGQGLQYLADTELRTMLPDQYSGDVESVVRERAQGQVRTEQHLDYLSVRYFRRTLLCRDDVRLDRALTGARLRGLQVSTVLAPDEPEAPPDGPEEATFRTEDGYAVGTRVPLVKAALLELCAARPQSLSLEEVAARARARLGSAPQEADLDALGGSFLEGFVRGYVTLGVWQRPYVLSPSERPSTTALVRYQAGRGQRGVTNLDHHSVATDSLDRALLVQLDGTRDRAALLEGVMERVQSGEVRAFDEDENLVADPEVFRELIDLKLPRLAERALLTS